MVRLSNGAVNINSMESHIDHDLIWQQYQDDLTNTYARDHGYFINTVSTVVSMRQSTLIC